MSDWSWPGWPPPREARRSCPGAPKPRHKAPHPLNLRQTRDLPVTESAPGAIYGATTHTAMSRPEVPGRTGTRRPRLLRSQLVIEWRRRECSDL